MLTAAAADVIETCHAIARCTEEPGCITRTSLSAPMHDVHALLEHQMRRAGMTTRVDAAGNLRGHYPASRPGAPTLFIGSHLDTVPHAGPFDGVLGVVMAVALVQLLEGAALPFAIDVIGFCDEEGVRFGAPFIGSRAFAGTLDEELLGRTDARGITVRDALRAFGTAPGHVAEAAATDGALGYLEIHIEQGPVLDSLDLPLAIVDSIAGQSRGEVTFSGEANHAGTTPMTLRKDAATAAAEWMLAVEREAQSIDGLVATVGRVDVSPNASNVIPGTCRVTLDVRHADDAVRRAAADRLVACARAIGARRRLAVHHEPRLDQPAVPMHPDMVQRWHTAVWRAGVPPHHMTSGAGHDAMVLAPRMPTGMLFLRSPRGVSHHPDEAVRKADVAMALRAGRELLAGIATEYHA